MTHLPIIWSIFGRVIDAGDSAATLRVLDLILADPDLAKTLDALKLAELLMRPDAHVKALFACEKYFTDVTFTTEIVTSLLCNGQSAKVATRILIKAAIAESVAAILASVLHLWVHVPLPTWKWTKKLLVKMLAFPAARGAVVASTGSAELLTELVTSGDVKLWKSALEIITLLPSSALFVAQCASCGFLEGMYKVAITKQEPSLMSDVFRLTEAFARVAYVPQYLVLLPVIRSLLAIAGWQGYAVSLLATLSMHKEARADLTKGNFGPTVAQFRGDAKLGKYAECYLKNVPVIAGT
jgi:hypothetical protein